MQNKCFAGKSSLRKDNSWYIYLEPYLKNRQPCHYLVFNNLPLLLSILLQSPVLKQLCSFSKFIAFFGDELQLPQGRLSAGTPTLELAQQVTNVLLISPSSLSSGFLLRCRVMLAGGRWSLGLMSGACIGLLCLYYGPVPWRCFLQPCLRDFAVTKLSWAQHLAVPHLDQCWVSWTLTAREREGRACPFVQNGPFCPCCICSMVSLKSSPKFRLTFLKPIIIHWHDCKKKVFIFRFPDYSYNWA